jgi:thiamine kinase-like enzyme
MFSNILSQLSNSISNRGPESSESSASNIEEPQNSINLTPCDTINSKKRNRASRSTEVTPEQELKRVREKSFESVSSYESDTEATISTPEEMDEDKLSKVVKALLLESEQRMAEMISLKLKPFEEVIKKLDRVESNINHLQQDAERLQQEVKRKNVIVYGIPEP